MGEKLSITREEMDMFSSDMVRAYNTTPDILGATLKFSNLSESHEALDENIKIAMWCAIDYHKRAIINYLLDEGLESMLGGVINNSGEFKND